MSSAVIRKIMQKQLLWHTGKTFREKALEGTDDAAKIVADASCVSDRIWGCWQRTKAPRNHRKAKAPYTTVPDVPRIGQIGRPARLSYKSNTWASSRRGSRRAAGQHRVYTLTGPQKKVPIWQQGTLSLTPYFCRPLASSKQHTTQVRTHAACSNTKTPVHNGMSGKRNPVGKQQTPNVDRVVDIGRSKRTMGPPMDGDSKMDGGHRSLTAPQYHFDTRLFDHAETSHLGFDLSESRHLLRFLVEYDHKHLFFINDKTHRLDNIGT